MARRGSTASGRDIVERTGRGENEREHSRFRKVLREVIEHGRARRIQLGAGFDAWDVVSMLTRAGTPNNVHAHPRHPRDSARTAFANRLIGRALRRQSYELNEENLFDAEYAISSACRSIHAKRSSRRRIRRETTGAGEAMRPDRDHLEIRFPRVEGYRWSFRWSI